MPMLLSLRSSKIASMPVNAIDDSVSQAPTATLELKNGHEIVPNFCNDANPPKP